MVKLDIISDKGMKSLESNQSRSSKQSVLQDMLKSKTKKQKNQQGFVLCVKDLSAEGPSLHRKTGHGTPRTCENSQKPSCTCCVLHCCSPSQGPGDQQQSPTPALEPALGKLPQPERSQAGAPGTTGAAVVSGSHPETPQAGTHPSRWE